MDEFFFLTCYRPTLCDLYFNIKQRRRSRVTCIHILCAAENLMQKVLQPHSPQSLKKKLLAWASTRGWHTGENVKKRSCEARETSNMYSVYPSMIRLYATPFPLLWEAVCQREPLGTFCLSYRYTYIYEQLMREAAFSRGNFARGTSKKGAPQRRGLFRVISLKGIYVVWPIDLC